MLKLLKTIFSAESLFFCFLFSGAIKIYLSLPIDFTIITFFLSVLAGLLILMQKPHLPNQSKYPLIIFFILSIVVLFSFFSTPSLLYGTDKVIRFLALTGWSIVGVFVFLPDHQSVTKFFNSGIIITASVCAFSLISSQQFIDSSIATGANRVGQENAIGLARMAGFGVIAIVCLKLIAHKQNKALNALLMLIVLYVLFLTGARMPLISLLLVLTFIIFLSIRFRKSGEIVIRKGLKLLAVFSALLSTIIYINWDNPQIYIMRLRLEMLFNLQGNIDQSSENRIFRFKESWEMFSSSPFIGQGAGSFSSFFDGKDIKSYPHNIFLELLAEQGLLGVILFTLLILSSLVIVFRTYINEHINAAQLGIILSLIYFFLNANVTGDINDNRILFAFIAMGYMLKNYKSENEESIIPDKKIRKRLLKKYKLTW